MAKCLGYICGSLFRGSFLTFYYIIGLIFYCCFFFLAYLFREELFSSCKLIFSPALGCFCSMILDRALRHQERLDARRSLEDSWATSVGRKKEQELEERRRAQSPGMLIHEQCDKYHRCKQCGRRPQNCGESNVWSESRYIPGSRLIV